MNNVSKLFLVGVLSLNITAVYADDDAVSISDTDAVMDSVTVDAVTDNAPDVVQETVSTSNVVIRMDCKTMKAKIDELNAVGDDAGARSLQMQYRKDCVVRASGLRSAYRGGGPNASPVNAGAVDVNSSKAVATVAAASTTVVPSTQEKKEEPVKVEISAAQIEMCGRLPDVIANKPDDEKSVLQETYDQYCAKDVVAPDAVIKTTMMVLGPVVPETPEVPAETDEEKYTRIAANLDAGLCPDGEKPNKYGCCVDETFKDLGNMEFACCTKDSKECFPPVK